MSDWIRRLLLLRAWYWVGRMFGIAHLQSQRCDQCGRLPEASWWDSSGLVWQAVAGNVNGCRHGCFCVDCFTKTAAKRGIGLTWIPQIVARRHSRQDED